MRERSVPAHSLHRPPRRSLRIALGPRRPERSRAGSSHEATNGAPLRLVRRRCASAKAEATKPIKGALVTGRARGGPVPRRATNGAPSEVAEPHTGALETGRLYEAYGGRHFLGTSLVLGTGEFPDSNHEVMNAGGGGRQGAQGDNGLRPPHPH